MKKNVIIQKQTVEAYLPRTKHAKSIKNTLKFLTMFILVFTMNACEEVKEKEELTGEQQKAYAEFEKMKKEHRYSFRMTEAEVQMLKKKDLKGLKKSLGPVSPNMSKLLTQNVNQPVQTQFPVSCGGDVPIYAKRVVVSELLENGEYHSYELVNHDACPTIYAQIPDVECTEFDEE
ncbi:MAG: hypothetical protein HRT58_12980 [Crocinitomicaceae bacterium]|nr:hypothetical protein [Flavobacteriales bacterium]NQZ36579.1 hypothetical protein [Crocinitomicaceae bacterium]